MKNLCSPCQRVELSPRDAFPFTPSYQAWHGSCHISSIDQDRQDETVVVTKGKKKVFIYAVTASSFLCADPGFHWIKFPFSLKDSLEH